MPEKKKPKPEKLDLFSQPELRGANLSLRKVPHSEESPEVRFLSEFIGEENEGGGIAGLLGALAGGGVLGTTRILRNGIPDPSARKMLTELVREKLGKLLEKNPLKAEALKVIDRYPRVAAHADLKNLDEITKDFPTHAPPKPNVQGAVVDSMSFADAPFNSELVNLYINPKTADPANTLSHELTHVAQALGRRSRRDMHDLYSRTSKITGYRDNPLEISARLAGDKSELKHMADPRNTLIDIVRKFWSTPQGRPKGYSALRQLDEMGLTKPDVRKKTVAKR